jgi:hypothetical protein
VIAWFTCGHGDLLCGDYTTSVKNAVGRTDTDLEAHVAEKACPRGRRSQKQQGGGKVDCSQDCEHRGRERGHRGRKESCIHPCSKLVALAPPAPGSVHGQRSSRRPHLPGCASPGVCFHGD